MSSGNNLHVGHTRLIRLAIVMAIALACGLPLDAGGVVSQRNRPRETPPKPSGSAQKAPPPQTPTPPSGEHPATRSFVRVPVIVSDRRGLPVVNLKPSDFEVWDEGALQVIDAVEYQTARHAFPPAATAAASRRATSDD